MFLRIYKYSKYCLLFLVIGLINSNYLYSYESSYILPHKEMLSEDAFDTLLIEMDQDNKVKSQRIKVAIKSSREGLLYWVVTYKDGRSDAFKLLEEDLSYITCIMHRYKFSFERSGSFYRGQYYLYKTSQEGPLHVEPVLVLDRPKLVFGKIKEQDELDDIGLDGERRYRVVDVNYRYKENNLDYIIFKNKKSFSEFNSEFNYLRRADFESLISQKMYLDLDNGISEVLVVDIGTLDPQEGNLVKRMSSLNGKNQDDASIFALVVPMDPLGGNTVGLDENISDENGFVMYLVPLTSLRREPVFKEDRDFKIGYNESGYYSLNPLKGLRSSEFFIHRYRYIRPILVFEGLNPKEKKKLFRPFSGKKPNFKNNEAYVSTLRKYLSSYRVYKSPEFYFKDIVSGKLIILNSFIPNFKGDCRKFFGLF